MFFMSVILVSNLNITNMKKKVLGILGAVVISGGAYFAYQKFNGEHVNSTVEYIDFLGKDSTLFISLLNSYNKEFIENTDDSNLLTNIIDRNGPKASRLNYNPFSVEPVNKDFIDTLVKSFHFWSYRKYLHLTQFYNDQKERTQDLPYFLNSVNYYQYDDKGDSIKSEKKDFILSSFKQAGGAQAILNTSNDLGNFTVYYSIHINKIMHDKMMSYDSLLKIDYDNLQERDSLVKLLNDDKYPLGSEEIKVSWVDQNAIPKKLQSNYLTVDAKIKGKKHKMCMLGMHIVGMVEKFPELLWATFEGGNLAPQNLQNKTDLTNLTEWERDNHPGLIAGNVHDSWLFYKKDGTSTKNKNSVLDYNKCKKKKFEHQMYRKNPLGFNQTDLRVSRGDSFYPFVFNHFLAINNMKKIAEKKADIKLRYNGSIWLNESNPEIFFGELENLYASKKSMLDKDVVSESSLAGSLRCSNITMESYQQDKNCFSCHSARHSVNPSTKDFHKVKSNNFNYVSFLNLSHVFTSRMKSVITKKVNPGISDELLMERVEEMKLEEELLLGN